MPDPSFIIGDYQYYETDGNKDTIDSIQVLEMNVNEELVWINQITSNEDSRIVGSNIKDNSISLLAQTNCAEQSCDVAIDGEAVFSFSGEIVFYMEFDISSTLVNFYFQEFNPEVQILAVDWETLRILYYNSTLIQAEESNMITTIIESFNIETEELVILAEIEFSPLFMNSADENKCWNMVGKDVVEQGKVFNGIIIQSICL